MSWGGLQLARSLNGVRTVVEEITIAGLGVIDAATVELGPGLTVLTGETGAGKTMVVTSLGLLCGGKADAARVRTGAEQALVQGRLRLAVGSPLLAKLAEAGVDLDGDGGDELLLARSVTSAAKGQGRSRAWVGSRSVPASFLAQLADELIAVHGQSDQQRLLRPSQQRLALDRYAGQAVAQPLQSYRQCHHQLAADQQRLEQVSSQAAQRAREAELLRDGLERIEAVNPSPGEVEQLQAEADRLAHAADVHAATSAAHALLAGAQDVDAASGAADAASVLAAANKQLGAASSYDPALADFAARVEQASYLVADVAADLAAYSSNVDTNPARLDAIGARREQLAGLTRRYADTLEQVLDWAQQASQRLAELDDDTSVIQTLQQQVQQGLARREELAAAVRAARTQAATRLAQAVTAELSSLALPQAQVQVQVSPADFGQYGADEVTMLLAANPGSPALALQQGASGGELSRVMLALEVVLAASDPVPLLVFDEVDAGVGGAAALEVGRRLARLARHAQVLVVTHLPQVAAYADTHLSVVKSSEGTITSSGVLTLEGEPREREIARMLAGDQGSATALAHAAELLAGAAAERHSWAALQEEAR